MIVAQGTQVRWKQDDGYMDGTVTESSEHTLTKTYQGVEVVIHGTPHNNALVIEQANGVEVMKAQDEVEIVD